MLALKICTCFVLSSYSNVLFNFLCVLILFQNTCSQLCFRSEHLQSVLFQIRTFAVSFISDQNTQSQLYFRPEHLQSPLFQIRTLAVSFVSDQNTYSYHYFRPKHLQSALFQILFQNTCSQLCFRPCCHPLDFEAPGSLYARRNTDSYTQLDSSIGIPVLTQSCLPHTVCALYIPTLYRTGTHIHVSHYHPNTFLQTKCEAYISFTMCNLP